MPLNARYEWVNTIRRSQTGPNRKNHIARNTDGVWQKPK
jgi:hypothetical protein